MMMVMVMVLMVCVCDVRGVWGDERKDLVWFVRARGRAAERAAKTDGDGDASR